jgi:hypothetical protein
MDLDDADMEEERRKRRIAVDAQIAEEVKEHLRREDARSTKWHLGREIPIAVIVMLVIQTCGVVWWAASLSAEQKSQRDIIVAGRLVQAEVDRRQDDEVQRSESRLLAAIDRVNLKLDRLIERRGP